MSYQTVPPTEPPAFEDNTPRVDGDNIPDDFKYSVNVSECELSIRHMFIRKVYSLLAVQIFASCLVGYVIRSNLTILNWSLNNLWLFFICCAGGIGFLIAANVYGRSYPKNLIFLGLFTLCEAYTLGVACALVETPLVVEALVLTFLIFLGLTIFAFQTKYDFVSWQGFLSVGLWSLLGLGFILMFFPHTSGLETVYLFLGAIIFSVYVIIDTQQLMKSCNLDDEVRACISLYLDILNLFLFILRILQNSNNRD